MWFSSWLRKQTVSRKHRPANRFRPALEMLEDRAVPATFLVNTTADILGHANGMLSLRQAIIDANAAPGPDTIHLRAGNYTLTRAGINEDAALTGDLDITGDLKIKGAEAGATTVDAAGLDRVFHVLSGADVTLSGMTIQGGAVSILDANDLGLLRGGGILNEGTLTVRESILTRNSTQSTTDVPGFGGGIYNLGMLTVSNSTLTDNSAADIYGFGGGIGNEGTLTIRGSTFSGNSAAAGGAIENSYGTVSVSNSTLFGNSAVVGGGIYSGGGALTVSNSTLSGNSATQEVADSHDFGPMHRGVWK